jgi:hypothetical protein
MSIEFILQRIIDDRQSRILIQIKISAAAQRSKLAG